MNREYRISRIIISIISAIGSYIALINEHYSFKILEICLFMTIAFLVSFLGTGVSRKMICVGDNIAPQFLKVPYYLSLLMGILLLTVLILIALQINTDWIDDLGTAVLFFLLECCIFIFLIVPYIQTIIVLLLRKILVNR